MGMRADQFTQFLTRAQAQYGAQFDARALSMQFAPYLGTGIRLKVRTMGEELTGTIGVTTGWKPLFLLMRRKSDHGSVWTLSDQDTIVAIKVGKVYKPVVQTGYVSMDILHPSRKGAPHA